MKKYLSHIGTGLLGFSVIATAVSLLVGIVYAIINYIEWVAGAICVIGASAILWLVAVASYRLGDNLWEDLRSWYLDRKIKRERAALVAKRKAEEAAKYDAFWAGKGNNPKGNG